LDDAGAAAVGHELRRLPEHEAVGGLGEIDAAGEGLAREDEPVGIGVEAAERGLHPPFTGEGPLGCSRGSTRLREYWDDLVAETHLRGLRRSRGRFRARGGCRGEEQE